MCHRRCFAEASASIARPFVQTIKATVLMDQGSAGYERGGGSAFWRSPRSTGLPPWSKELHAFVDTKTGGIVPIVGIDGGTNIATT